MHISHMCTTHAFAHMHTHDGRGAHVKVRGNLQESVFSYHAGAGTQIQGVRLGNKSYAPGLPFPFLTRHLGLSLQVSTFYRKACETC